METEKQTGTEPAVLEDDKVRHHPIFVKELDKAHKKAKELETRLAELEAAQVERAKLLETKKLEEAGKYNEVLAQREAELVAKTKEIKLLQEQAARNLIGVEAKAELRSAGLISDPEIIELYARKYAETNADNTALPEYITTLKTEKPYLFSAAVSAPPKGRPAPMVTPATTGSASDLKSRLFSTDPNVRAAARREEFDGIVAGKLSEDWDAAL